jgi:hypothetical protein
LRETSVPDGIYRGAPDENAREEMLLRKLGAKGWGRLYQFRRLYGDGWGEGRQQALSPRAVEALHRFLEAVEFPAKGRPPSLFLTDHGGLELCWEDAAGQAVQVEFGPAGVEYFRAAKGAEGTAGFAEVRGLARELSAP